MVQPCSGGHGHLLPVGGRRKRPLRSLPEPCRLTAGRIADDGDVARTDSLFEAAFEKVLAGSHHC